MNVDPANTEQHRGNTGRFDWWLYDTTWHDGVRESKHDVVDVLVETRTTDVDRTAAEHGTKAGKQRESTWKKQWIQFCKFNTVHEGYTL